MSFLHGVETIEKQVGPVPVNTVKTAVIGVVGTSPKGEPGKMHLVQSESDFEENLGAGGTLEDALSAIWDHCNPTILAINAFDPLVHYEAHEVEFYACQGFAPLDEEAYALEVRDGAEEVEFELYEYPNRYIIQNSVGNEKYKAFSISVAIVEAAKNTGNAVVSIPVEEIDGANLIAKLGGDEISLVAENDYAFQAGGMLDINIGVFDSLTPLDGDYSFCETKTLTLTYRTPDMSKVTVSNIVNAFPEYEKALSEFGFFPKILIAPGFSQELAVGREMVAVAEKIRAMAYIDAPEGLNPTEAVQFKSTNYGDARAMFCYPKVKIWDNAQGVYRFDWL